MCSEPVRERALKVTDATLALLLSEMASPREKQTTNYALRMILLGETGAGKSSLFYRIKHKVVRSAAVL